MKNYDFPYFFVNSRGRQCFLEAMTFGSSRKMPFSKAHHVLWLQILQSHFISKNVPLLQNVYSIVIWRSNFFDAPPSGQSQHLSLFICFTPGGAVLVELKKVHLNTYFLLLFSFPFKCIPSSVCCVSLPPSSMHTTWLLQSVVKKSTCLEFWLAV